MHEMLLTLFWTCPDPPGRIAEYWLLIITVYDMIFMYMHGFSILADKPMIAERSYTYSS